MLSVLRCVGVARGMLGSRQPRAGNVSFPSCRTHMCSQIQDWSSTVPRKTKQGMNSGIPTPVCSYTEQAAAHKGLLD